MPAKKKSTAKPSSGHTTDSIRRELQQAFADASKKLKTVKGQNVQTKAKLVTHAKNLIDIIWPC